MVKGSLSRGIMDSVLNTFPLDFTVIDEDDKIVAWNNHENRLFKRAESVLGKDVRACHHRESIPRIESILAILKSGAANEVDFWLENSSGEPLNRSKIWVVYWALRDENVKYLGCMETTQVVDEGEKPVEPLVERS
jgi:uncharacterized protein